VTELEFLRQQHQDGRIARRAFLGRAAALGAGAALLAGMVAGIDAHAAETPRQGGTLRLGLGGGSTTDSCDPRSYTDSVMVDAGRALFNGLVEWGQDGKPAPELAESWEARPGAAEWVLNLKKGVTFTNGKTFDADDAIYSINLHRGQTKSGAAGAFKAVKDVKKLSDSQISIALDSGDADFAYVLTDYHMLIVPNGFADWAKPVGTGPFVLDRFEPGVRFAAKRHAGYWKPNRGHLDAIDITVINDTSARLNALMTGQVDAINRLDPKLAPLVQKNQKLEIVRAAGGWHTVVSMMRDKPPFDNIDLRQALQWGIDREQIVKVLFAGFGTVGNDQPIPKTDPYYNPTLPQIHFDADRAKFHLKKAGGAPSITIQASDAAFNGAVDMATLMQASAAKAGLTIDVKKEPADGFWDNVWLKGACVTSYWAGRSAATQMLSVAYGPDAPWNESHFKSPRFTALLAAARAELDEPKRRVMIWEMQTILHDDAATIVPAFRDWVDAHNRNVGGHTPHGGFDMDNGLIADKAWLKA
jgi:peptide/nickel transport system substrate-binding protein